MSQYLPSSFVRRVERTLNRFKMIAAGERLLVAISGGPDSTALLSVLLELSERRGVSLRAAHFNHGLRGNESDRDQDAVEQLCARLNVPLSIGRGDSAPGSNIEERARTARYDFLFRTAAELGCTRIATGHTRDDQAETFLMRLVRGSGLDGMVGIRPVRADGVIRPLIESQRTHVIDYLSARGVSYCADSMNSDPRFLRTRVRHELLPWLTSVNPAIVRTIARTARSVAADVETLDRLARDALGAAETDAGGLVVSRLQMVPENLRGRVVRQWLRRRRGLRGLGATHLAAVYDLTTGGSASRRIELPKRGAVLREYDSLRYEDSEPAVTQSVPRPVGAGTSIDLDGGWHLTASLVPNPVDVPASERNHWHFWADADAIKGQLSLRSARRGDRIQPLGLAGHRKLQDVFVDRKLPRQQRWTHPVLEADGEILWVPGLMRSGRALVSGSTRAAWRVVMQAVAVAGR